MEQNVKGKLRRIHYAIRSAISETIYCIEVFMTTRHALSIYTGLNEMILELSETVNGEVAQYDWITKSMIL